MFSRVKMLIIYSVDSDRLKVITTIWSSKTKRRCRPNPKVFPSYLHKYEVEPAALNTLSFKDLIVRLSLLSRKSFWSNTHAVEIARRLSLSCTPWHLRSWVQPSACRSAGTEINGKGLLWAVGPDCPLLSAFSGPKSMKHFPKAAWDLVLSSRL